MLSVGKLNEICNEQKMAVDDLANHLVTGNFSKSEAVKAIKNWKNGLMKPIPKTDDINRLATALGVETGDISEWRSSLRFAPISPRKARLVTQLIIGKGVQDAMDILKFANKRAASIIDKVLKSAVANADEQRADVDELYVCEARVDDAGIRIGTKRWMAKDRGRAHPIQKKACHIHVSVTQE
jgi:large subunit ribosomal protein L22